LAFDATLRAAAPYQKRRRRDGVAVVIELDDLREKVREKRVANFLLFAVDASGSMGAQQRMVEAKDHPVTASGCHTKSGTGCGMVAFRGEEAEVILPPTNSVERAQKLLERTAYRGRDPSLCRAYEIV